MMKSYPLLAVLLLVPCLAGAACSETSFLPDECLMELGVLDYGSIYVPSDYILAVDGSIKHGEISFVLKPSKRSSDRYSNITISKVSEEHNLDEDYVSETGEVCGISYHEPLGDDKNSHVAPALSFLFFEIGDVIVSIGSMQRRHALKLMRILLRDSCE